MHHSIVCYNNWFIMFYIAYDCNCESCVCLVPLWAWKCKISRVLTLGDVAFCVAFSIVFTNDGIIFICMGDGKNGAVHLNYVAFINKITLGSLSF